MYLFDMLRITTKVDRNGYYPQSEFECDTCSGIISFYSLTPKSCHICGKKVTLDVKGIMHGENNRINYYRNDKDKEVGNA